MLSSSSSSWQAASFRERPQVWLKSIASQNSFVIDVDTRSRTTSVVGSKLKPSFAPAIEENGQRARAVSFNPSVLVHQLSNKNIAAKTRDRTGSPHPTAASTIAKPTANMVQASKHPLALVLQVPQYAVVMRQRANTAPRMNRVSTFSSSKHHQPKSVLVAHI